MTIKHIIGVFVLAGLALSLQADEVTATKPTGQNAQNNSAHNAGKSATQPAGAHDAKTDDNAASADWSKRPLHIYLPRSITIGAGDKLTLGSICIIHSRDPELLKRASEVAMGRAPFPKETLTIHRRIISSRLAASHIPADKVLLTGAPRVAVRRNEKTIDSSVLLKAAEAYLRTHRPGPAGSGWKLARKIDGLVLPADENTKLSVRQAAKSPNGHIKLVVSAGGGKDESSRRKHASCEVLFKITYLHPQAVLKKDVRAGELLTSRNIEIRSICLDRPGERDWTPPLGMLAAKNLKAGTVLRGNLVRPRALSTVIRRNQIVSMVVRGSGFVITAKGQALQDGKPDEFIKVRNINTKRIVIARVCHDGTVDPSVGR